LGWRGGYTPGVFAKSAEVIEKEGDALCSFAGECKKVQETVQKGVPKWEKRGKTKTEGGE
jgi:hypothetical protein